jgi:VanZ family protein
MVFRVAFAVSTMFLLAVLGRFCKYWLPLILWMTVIFSASTRLGAPDNTSHFLRPLLHWLYPRMSEETFAQIHYFVRKTAHFVEYAMLGVLVWRVVRFDAAFSGHSFLRQIWFTLLFCMFYASTDEFHQKFVATREPAIHDVVIDTCGASFGLLTALGAGKLLGTRKNSSRYDGNQPT